MRMISKVFKSSVLLALFTVLANSAAYSAAMAQESPETQHMQHDYMSAMSNMHESMQNGAQEENPDIAFAKGMLPHHQGAVAMAQIELKYGKDPEMRALAENVIRSQRAEIKQMQDWLAKHPK